MSSRKSTILHAREAAAEGNHALARVLFERVGILYHHTGENFEEPTTAVIPVITMSDLVYPN